MNNYEILETCLRELEEGAELELLLARYPDQADELRPILVASRRAKGMAVPPPSPELLRRNRAKLLQRAAQLRVREKSTFTWIPTLRRMATVLAILVILLFSGTRLVSASSAALPGDQLYPVKRSWENVVLFFTFNMQARNALEVEYENERLNELQEIFASGRSAKVEFSGIVQRENGNGWWIDKVLVIVSSQTALPSQSIQIGMAVRVEGETRGNGVVLAGKIEALPAGAALPEAEVDHEQPAVETEEHSATPTPVATGSASESESETPDVRVITDTPVPASTPKIESFSGVLMSIGQDTWKIGDALVKVDDAQIIGVPVIGGSAKAEGYFDSNGIFIASKIEFLNSGSNDSNLNSNTNTNSDDGSSGSNINGQSGSNNNNDDHSGSGNGTNDHEDNSNVNGN